MSTMLFSNYLKALDIFSLTTPDVLHDNNMRVVDRWGACRADFPETGSNFENFADTDRGHDHINSIRAVTLSATPVCTMY